MQNAAKPTKQQLAWHEMELGVLIHYCLEMYRPDLPGAVLTVEITQALGQPVLRDISIF